MSMIIIYGAVIGPIMCSVYAIPCKNFANYNSFLYDHGTVEKISSTLFWKLQPPPQYIVQTQPAVGFER
jgi:hypothetical protein